ncbi:MAG: beta-glucosidase [bacterium]|nr:beta-glucosidase [bacterium]
MSTERVKLRLMMNQRFNSFIMGGFECSTHRDKRGRRLDLINSTRHDEFADRDYQRMVDHGMLTARDGVRWHLIEKEPNKYDFSSLERQVTAAKDTGIEIIWDYFHYGYPDDLDIFSDQFSERFCSFSEAVTQFLMANLAEKLHVCPVNEISFYSWIAADRGHFHPAVVRRSHELKRLLIQTSTAAVRRIREVNPDTTIMFTEPAIHVVPKDHSPQAKRSAESYRRSQFEALDALERSPADESLNDVIGLNYYFHNQWRYPSRRKIPRGHKLYRPLNEILTEFYERYQRPLLIAETGIEDDERAEWFRYVCDQVAIAIDNGVPMQGICLYPIANHPGWADNRHCHNGLWDYADDRGEREIHTPLSEEIALQIERFDRILKEPSRKTPRLAESVKAAGRT